VHEHHGGVGDRQRHRHVLLDQQHADASLVCDPPDHTGQLVDDPRRQPQAHLVDEQKPWPADEGTGDGQHRLLAA
jgi:hypothetical protein